jgi:hypothetical protein
MFQSIFSYPVGLPFTTQFVNNYGWNLSPNWPIIGLIKFFLLPPTIRWAITKRPLLVSGAVVIYKAMGHQEQEARLIEQLKDILDGDCCYPL